MLTSHHDVDGCLIEELRETILGYIRCCHPVRAVFRDQRFIRPARHGHTNNVGKKSLVEGDGVVRMGTFLAIYFSGVPKI